VGKNARSAFFPTTLSQKRAPQARAREGGGNLTHSLTE
jgi:hypothetical protein